MWFHLRLWMYPHRFFWKQYWYSFLLLSSGLLVQFEYLINEISILRLRESNKNQILFPLLSGFSSNLIYSHIQMAKHQIGHWQFGTLQILVHRVWNVLDWEMWV